MKSAPKTKKSKVCHHCDGRGWAILHFTRSSISCISYNSQIQRCDTCKKFDSDKSALEAALSDPHFKKYRYKY